MPTLSELSTQLFRDVQANHQDCLADLDQVERDRTAALAAIPDAAPGLAASRKETLAAEAARDERLMDIDTALQKDERKAESDRALALRAIEQGLKDADATALRTRQAAEQKARADLQADLAAIAGDKKTNAGAKLLARRDAERAFDEAMRSIHTAFLASLAANKNAQVDKFRAALTREALDSRMARDEALAKREETERLFDRATKAAETRLRNTLAGLASADAAQRRFDDHRAQIKAACRNREAELFAVFQKAKEGLTG